MKNLILLIVVCAFIFSCTPHDPNQDESGVDIIQRNTIPSIGTLEDHNYADTTYLAAYSEVYSQIIQRTIPLTITLSIRSGSFTDTTFIKKITYFDTEGKIIKEYLNDVVILKPMQSIDYIVPLTPKSSELEVSRGGIGAHFVVEWGAKYNTQPIMHCLMHGSINNQSVSFVVPGKSISLRNVKK